MENKLLRLLDRRYLAFYAQRRFRSPALRQRIGGWVSSARPAATHVSHLEPALRGKLTSDGIAQLGAVLSAAEVNEVRGWLSNRKVVDYYHQDAGSFLPEGEGRNPNSHVANHDFSDVLRAPHLLALANRPSILAIVEEYLGCKPAITSFSAWWSYATPAGPQHAELFHRDVDDWRFIKLFVYLSDVGPEQGPHVYVKGSAGRTELREIRRLDDGEVGATFGAENIMRITGKAGSAFLEDTSGVHKGTPVANGRRLLFQAVYGLVPLPDAPRTSPVTRAEAERLHGVSLDPYVNGFILR